jgi:hypothetical protein
MKPILQLIGMIAFLSWLIWAPDHGEPKMHRFTCVFAGLYFGLAAMPWLRKNSTGE